MSRCAGFDAYVTCQAASNQVVSGVRVLSKIVPAVIDVWYRHIGQTKRSRVSLQGIETDLQAGQVNPSGQRSCSKYALHAASSGNILTKSLYVFGYSYSAFDVDFTAPPPFKDICINYSTGGANRPPRLPNFSINLPWMC